MTHLPFPSPPFTPCAAPTDGLVYWSGPLDFRFAPSMTSTTATSSSSSVPGHLEVRPDHLYVCHGSQWGYLPYLSISVHAKLDAKQLYLQCSTEETLELEAWLTVDDGSEVDELYNAITKAASLHCDTENIENGDGEHQEEDRWFTAEDFINDENSAEEDLQNSSKKLKRN